MTISQNDNKSEEETIIAGLINLTYKLSNNNKIGINILRNQGGLSTARFKYGPKPDDDLFMYENTLGYLERGFTSTQLKGKHTISKLNNTTIEWISSYTNSQLNEPDLRFFNYDKTGETYKISYNAYPSPTRFYRDLEEINFDNKLHITIPFDFSGNSSKFKIGGAYVYKDRISQSRKFDILSQGVPFNGNITEYLSLENIGQNATDATYGVYMQNDPLTDAYNSYNANELIASSYAMIDLALTENLRIVTGARYEFDKIFIENNVEKTHSKYVNAEHTYNKDILPALNITYSVTDEMNIRAAVSRTLARPSFREIAPYSYYDFKEGWRVVGNPELQRTLIDNYDLRWENYLRPGELISLSVFYKKFYNAIELVDDPRANNPEFHYINIENSMLYGAEIELRKQLFDGLAVGGNFTYVKSEVIEPTENYQVAILTNPEFTGVRPMYGQAPWIVNTFVNYENEKIGLSSNIGFNVSGQKLVVVTKGGTPNVYEHPSSNLNFNIAKKIGEKFTMKFAVDNILNSELRRTYTYQNKEYVFQSYKMGRVFSFSVNYLID
jgi:TonB-dependent receptor